MQIKATTSNAANFDACLVAVQLASAREFSFNGLRLRVLNQIQFALHDSLTKLWLKGFLFFKSNGRAIGPAPGGFPMPTPKRLSQAPLSKLSKDKQSNPGASL